MLRPRLELAIDADASEANEAPSECPVMVRA